VVVADIAEESSLPSLHVDVTNPDDIRDSIRGLVELHGRLDYAVNCAGIEGVRANTADYPDHVWAQVMAVNLTGVFRCMKEELAVMLAQGGRAIVNVASVAGVIGFASHCAYTASKHGVVGLTKTAAVEYARSNIRVNAVCPAYTRTPMVETILNSRPELEERLQESIPVGRFCTPEEVAGAILYLCSDTAGFITGECLILDGGLTA
jgi:NAD(P)-dependent dehydrogenase (short-subunit alcohol dehydrogenase family)